jgi:hypothetical protein
LGVKDIGEVAAIRRDAGQRRDTSVVPRRWRYC